MGVDKKWLAKSRERTAPRKFTRSTDVYNVLLARLYKFLARRASTPFNKTVLKRLLQVRQNKRPICLGKLVEHLNAQPEEKKNSVAVIVGTITNDIRLLDVPQGLRVCALHVTETARKRIVEHGGQVLSFDQLAQVSPDGKGCLLLRGNKNTEKRRHFGLAPGQSGSHAKPYKHGSTKRTGSRYGEIGRGRRASRQYCKKA
ncbi:hypothetical protein ABK040_008260 [Willaertia magna]